MYKRQVFPGLTHADDTTGAGTHAFGFDFFEGLDLHVVGAVSYTHLDVYKRQGL